MNRVKRDTQQSTFGSCSSISYGAIHLVFNVVGFLGVSILVVPWAASLFEDFDFELPVATAMVISCARIVATHWPIALAIFVQFAIVDFVLLRFVFQDSTLRTLWIVAVLIPPILFGGTVLTLVLLSVDELHSLLACL